MAASAIERLARALGRGARHARIGGRRARILAERIEVRALGVRSGAGRYDDAPSRETKARLARLRARNLLSRRSVLGTARVVVVMTTTRPRIDLVWAAIESIASGSVRPERIVLYLDDPTLEVLPRSLARLQRRGLQVVRVEPGLRVHTKWRPFAISKEQHDVPMVTSDDDQLYPTSWLAELLEASQARPGAVVAQRAHRLRIIDGRLAPYLEWVPASSVEPSFAHFGTSVSGQLVPPAVVDALRDRGEGFLTLTPTADDVWLHATAVAAGARTAQVHDAPSNYAFVPGTQTEGLYVANVFEGANDAQLAAALTEDLFARVMDDAG